MASEDKLSKVKIPDRPFILNMPPVETGGCSIVMVGSTRSGKSTALKHVLDTYFSKHVGVLFSQSIHAHAYKDMNYPLIAKSGAFDPVLIHDMYAINKETNNHYPFLTIIDDCPLIKNDKELMKLATIYRNSGLSFIGCVQNMSMLNPTTRSNINFVMLFKLNNTETIEKTIKGFLRGYLPVSWNYEQKIAWYNKMTQDHHFIFIDCLNSTIQRCKIDID
jgi:hypothetical protein